MECKESQPLLHAYVDGELDLVRQLEIETHLQTCVTCAQIVEDLRASRSALRAHLPRYTASRELMERIQKSIPKEENALRSDSPSAKPRGSVLPFLRWGG